MSVPIASTRLDWHRTSSPVIDAPVELLEDGGDARRRTNARIDLVLTSTASSL